MISRDYLQKLRKVTKILRKNGTYTRQKWRYLNNLSRSNFMLRKYITSLEHNCRYAFSVLSRIIVVRSQPPHLGCPPLLSIANTQPVALCTYVWKMWTLTPNPSKQSFPPLSYNTFASSWRRRRRRRYFVSHKTTPRSETPLGRVPICLLDSFSCSIPHCPPTQSCTVMPT